MVFHTITIPGYHLLAPVIILLLVPLFRDQEFKSVFYSKACICFVLLILYHIVNCRLKVTPHELSMSMGYDNYKSLWIAISASATVLVLTPFLFLKDEFKAEKFVTWAYLIFVIFGTLLLLRTADADNRMKGGSIHPNQLAQGCGMALMFFTYLKFKRQRPYSYLIKMSIIPMFGIAISTSRNGLALAIIFLFTVAFASMLKDNGVSTKKMTSLFLIFALGFLGIYMIGNTEAGSRIIESDESAITELETGTILDYLGERAWYYYLGWLNFLDNPLTGIGLWHFDTYNGFGYPLHTEYMIHLCEGGIVGAGLYFIFIAYLLRNLVRNFRMKKSDVNFILLMMLFAYMFVGISAREFYFTFFYPILGICIYHIEQNKKADYDYN